MGGSSGVRVTVAAGRERVDLTVPGDVPVVELLPELARALGVLTPDLAGQGYRLRHLDGRVLRADRGLVGQQVVDGAVLWLGAPDPAPQRYDDVAEAVADLVAQHPARLDRRVVVLVVAWVAVVLLGVVLAARLAPVGLGRALGVAAALLALASLAAPGLAAAALGPGPPHPMPDGAGPEAALAGRACRVGGARRALHALWLAGVAVLALSTPTMAALGPEGGLLVLTCLVVLVVGRPHARAPAEGPAGVVASPWPAYLGGLCRAAALVALPPLLVLVAVGGPRVPW